MIDLNIIKENKEAVIAALQRRGIGDVRVLVGEILTLAKAQSAMQVQMDTLAAALNKLNGVIGKEIQDTGETLLLLTQRVQLSKWKEELKFLTEQYKAYQSSLVERLCQLPNLPHATVPTGQHAEANQMVYQTALIAQVDAASVAHWELIKKYDIIDFELGNKITGAGFPLYKGKGARLQRALINFFLDKAWAGGYQEVSPPILVNEASAYATGQLPDKEGQMYHIASDGLYAIPTAEVPITNMYRNSRVSLGDLPIKHVGYTACFRREAGSWGADVRGLNRLHQFDKVELVQICHPDDSYTQLEEMLSYVRALVEQLELPYRVVKLCTGDLGFAAAMTYDIEVYSVGQAKWLEVSSISNFETFQANRLALRYKDKKKKSHLLHTLNGSALALPRLIAALLEYNQTLEGITIPKVLQPYTGFDRID